MSPLPLPSVEVLNISTKICDVVCLKKLESDGLIFSFLALINTKESNNELSPIAFAFMDEVNIDVLPSANIVQNIFIDDVEFSGEQFKIALLLPKKVIGRYSISATNTVLSYLLYRGIPYQLKVYDSKYEDIQNINSTLAKIREDGYDKVISILTLEGTKSVLDSNTEGLKIYIPTVNSTQVGFQKDNIYYGGIDYRGQIESLLAYGAEKVAIFHDSSTVSALINSHIENSVKNIVLKEQIDDLKNIDFKNIMQKNASKLNGASVFINTPLVTSSIIMSQIRFHDIKPTNILSTQINYNPAIFNLTQYGDRKGLLMSNSIINNDLSMTETGRLFDVDLRFDWVNYSVAVGVDYFYSNMFERSSIFPEDKMENNQVKYPIEIFRSTSDGFRGVKE